MRGMKLYGIVAAAFMAGAFIASPELRAYASTVANDVICSGCVGTSDLAGNAVTAAKIKDGEVKAPEIAANAVGASEIAANAVGASELQGVTKLMFTACSFTVEGTLGSGGTANPQCSISGLTESDRVILTKEFGNPCYAVTNVEAHDGNAIIWIVNSCSGSTPVGTMTFNVIVYKPG